MEAGLRGFVAQCENLAKYAQIKHKPLEEYQSNERKKLFKPLKQSFI